MLLPLGVIDQPKAICVFISLECSVIRSVCDFDERKIGRRKYNELRSTLQPVTQDGDHYSMVLSFKKGDYMMTTAPDNIG